MYKPTEEQTRNKLVLIGNGFDLAHGLKTRYSDFILWYLNKQLKNAYENSRNYSDNYCTIKLRYDFAFSEDFISFEKFNNCKRDGLFSVDIKNDFIKTLVNQHFYSNWVDIESFYYEYLLKILKQYGDYLIEIIKLNDCFDYLKEYFIEYLSSIEIDKNLINKCIKSKINEFIDNTINYNRKIKNDTDRVNFLFLNFNYTKTIDLYITRNYRNIKVNNIHGRLNDKNNPIIFGYGDEMDKNYSDIESINKNEYLKNIKSFSYFKTRNYQDLSLFINSKEFEVYIMGHSCGLSDRILLNSIFENSKCKKIQIYYHKRSENDNDFFEKTQEISRHFKAINKDRMRNLITNFNDCKPLT